MALWEDVQWPWSFILTLWTCHSQTYLDLFAFVIANTFPVISTSQNCVTLSTIKQWGSFFFFSILKKDFWHRLRYLENCCHWKWKKRQHKGRSIFRATFSFQRTDSRNCSFCEIEYFLWTSPPPILNVPTHCLKRDVASFLHRMPIRHFFLSQIY